MCSEVGSSTVPVPFPMVWGQFRLKFRKCFESCLFLSRALKVIAISPGQFSTGDTLFQLSKLIHVVDKEVDEERFTQHNQTHPDTSLSTASPCKVGKKGSTHIDPASG